MASILRPYGIDQKLPVFLSHASSKPFQFGEWDCAMTLANWFRFVHGIDPAKELRGSYSTDAGWKRIVLRAGSLVNIVSSLCVPYGWSMQTEPMRGDIAVVKTDSTPTGAIWTGCRWTAKSPGGLSSGPAEAIQIWGVR